MTTVWDLVCRIRDKQDFPARTYSLGEVYQVLDNCDDEKISPTQFSQLTSGFSQEEYSKLLRRLIKRSTHMELAVHNIRTLLAATPIRGLRKMVECCPNPILALFLRSVLNKSGFKLFTIASRDMCKNLAGPMPPDTIACSAMSGEGTGHQSGPVYHFEASEAKRVVFTYRFRSNGFNGQSTIVGRETIPLAYHWEYYPYEIDSGAFTINLTHGYGYVYVVEY